MLRQRIELGPWVPLSRPPERSGTYEMLHTAFTCFAHWDGNTWTANAEDHGHFACNLGDLQSASHWRGLTRDPQGSGIQVSAGRLSGIGSPEARLGP